MENDKKHICEWYMDADKESRVLNEASFIQEPGARDSKMTTWTSHWEASTGPGKPEGELLEKKKGRE